MILRSLSNLKDRFLILDLPFSFPSRLRVHAKRHRVGPIQPKADRQLCPGESTQRVRVKQSEAALCERRRLFDSGRAGRSGAAEIVGELCESGRHFDVRPIE